MKNIRSHDKKLGRLPSKICFPCLILLAACNPSDFQRLNTQKDQSAKQSAIIPGFTAEESRLIDNYRREPPTQIIDVLISKIDNQEFSVYGIEFKNMRKMFELMRPRVEEIEERWGTFDEVFASADLPRSAVSNKKNLKKRFEILHDYSEKILAGEFYRNDSSSVDEEDDTTYETDSLDLRRLSLNSVPVYPDDPIQCNLVHAEIAMMDEQNAAVDCNPVEDIDTSTFTGMNRGSGVIPGPAGASVGATAGFLIGAQEAVANCARAADNQDYYFQLQTAAHTSCRDATAADQPTGQAGTEAATQCLQNNLGRGPARIRCMVPPIQSSIQTCSPNEVWNPATQRCDPTV